MEKTPKNPSNYCCNICYFISSNLKDYNRHINTRKHINRTTLNENNPKKPQKIQEYACPNCNKLYKARNSLWYHQKTCVNTNININANATDNKEYNNDEINNNCFIDKELIMLLIKENNELKHIMTETHTQMKEIIKNGINNTHTNSHNKTFNLNFFLNETCKNAMNIMDFVSNLQLQLNDLEKMGEIGYVNGMSEIIIKNLKDMDVTERPIHCTDKKRETLYIKDEDKWDKEPNDHPKVRNAIKHIAHKNSKLLNEFKEKYPDYNNSSSKVSDTYNKILIETMGGKGDNDLEKENKIIRNVTKEIVVDKE
jgi:hypothetical protein